MEKRWEIPKELWADGPWKNEPDDAKFVYNGYECELWRNISGCWCGYIGLPPTSKFYPKQDEMEDYDNVSNYIDIHGGFTYGKLEDGKYWVGFDCAHYGDIMPACFALLKNFKQEMLGKISDPHAKLDLSKDMWPNAQYRTIEFAMNQLKRAIDQIIEAEKK